MQPLSDRAGSVGESQTSGESGWLEDPYGRKIDLQSLFGQANSIPLITIISHYGQRVDDYNRRIRCPFHKGGNERTPSMWIYPETNSFHCFGCKASGRNVEFVAKNENLTKTEASLFIIEKWGNLLGTNIQAADLREAWQDKLFLEFSKSIRQFIQTNPTKEALEYAEKLSFSFDKLCHKHKLNSDAMISLIQKIKNRLEIY